MRCPLLYRYLFLALGVVALTPGKIFSEESNRYEAYFADISKEELIQRALTEMQISAVDRAIIHDLIHTVAKTNVISLGFKQKELENLGKQLRVHGVNVLQFLAHILSSKTLNNDLQSISKNHFKWNGVMKGVMRGLTTLKSGNEYQKRFTIFALYLDVDERQFFHYFNNNDWNGLVKALLKATASKSKRP